ncbi:hypothetical protein LDENG_00152840 [Lucifuga dentata]|nr:hypothetical protein LDENG_00152840 [Lucifuga dentata]
MGSNEERFEANRPQSPTRPPVRLQDFEVAYPGYRDRDNPPHAPHAAVTEHVTFPQLEGPVQMTPFYSTPRHPDSIHGDAAHPTASHLGPARSRMRDHMEPRHRTALCDHLRAIQRENAQLLYAQQALHVDLRELREVRSEFKELISAARTLQADLSSAGLGLARQSSRASSPAFTPLLTCLPSYHLQQVELDAEEEEEWPAPPPWLEPDKDLCKCVTGIKLEHHGAAPHKPQEVSEGLGIPPPNPPSVHQQSYPTAPYTLPPPPISLESFQPPHPVMPSSQKYHPAPTGHLGYPPAPRPQSVSPTQVASRTFRYAQPPVSEPVYRGPQPTIPKLIRPDPSEFARLRIALENLLPPDGTELFKYQILVAYLKVDEARLIADAYLNSPTPYTNTLVALHEKFGQPHQLALKKIASVLEAPDVRLGDSVAFQKFVLQVQSLVGLLETLGPEGRIELQCGSHVAQLLSKLPPEQWAKFCHHMYRQCGTTHTLHDLSDWLCYESWCQSYDEQSSVRSGQVWPNVKSDHSQRTVTVLHGVGKPSETFPHRLRVTVTREYGRRKPEPTALIVTVLSIT